MQQGGFGGNEYGPPSGGKTSTEVNAFAAVHFLPIGEPYAITSCRYYWYCRCICTVFLVTWLMPVILHVILVCIYIYIYIYIYNIYIYIYIYASVIYVPQIYRIRVQFGWHMWQ